MDDRENGAGESLKDSYAHFRDERRVEDILTKAVRATGLAKDVCYQSVRIVSYDEEGEGYAAFFGLAVDLGKIPASTNTAKKRLTFPKKQAIFRVMSFPEVGKGGKIHQHLTDWSRP